MKAELRVELPTKEKRSEVESVENGKRAGISARESRRVTNGVPAAKTNVFERSCLERLMLLAGVRGNQGVKDGLFRPSGSCTVGCGAETNVDEY